MFLDDSDASPTVTFRRVYPGAFPPMRADKSALGGMPTVAFRHCEPMRIASGMGWYVFPPEDIHLRWNGSDIFYLLDGEWQPVSRESLPGFDEHWDERAPEDLKGLAPPWLTRFRVFPGALQIWSGLLCSTKPGWSLLIRPLVNIRGSHLYSCYEGLVEADSFKPFPLFTNIQLIATDVTIELPKTMPLFQVQAVPRASYSDIAHRSLDIDGLEEASMSAQDWEDFRGTIHVDDDQGLAEEGKYTIATRKRAKGIE
ncbi:MAG TPA: hypothetical protein VFS43_45315 [Polyangiaceae bacterium]|nr:hypothetical protein [Polyangiaceae bacterium]